jgi:hypothetical protein
VYRNIRVSEATIVVQAMANQLPTIAPRKNRRSSPFFAGAALAGAAGLGGVAGLGAAAGAEATGVVGFGASAEGGELPVMFGFGSDITVALLQG